MSIDAIKNWFADIDISHTDWRLRWPLMLLPFLLLGMLYFLFKANQLNARYIDDSSQFQQLLQTELSATRNNRSNENAAPQLQVTAAPELQKFKQGMEELETNARLLQEWLLQGRNTEIQAQQAGGLIDLTTHYRTAGTALPDLPFWDAMLMVLVDLENAASDGSINTPEAQDLVRRLFEQHDELRTASFASTPLKNPTNLSSENNELQPSQQQVVADDYQQLQDQRADITRMHNRALVLAALSTALFGLLLWGMWRTSKNRQHAYAGRNRSEQGAILKLLDEISPLAQGDLRVKATVSEASTGAVADAFNYAVEELTRLVLAVTESADLVKQSVSDTRESAHHLARASSVQAREIHRSSNYLSVMSDTMAQLSEHAVESSRIADLSVQQARAGTASVQANVEGLVQIREQAEMTSRLMQRLVETSALINERVVDIQSVAKRTDLLALNTTIRSAAQVGHSGSATVTQLSHDVAHLADTLGRASRDIANLSDLIQQDATITLESMAKTVAEVDENQRAAKLARQNLTEIDRVSNELNGLISHIATKALRQAGVVKQLSANMGVINNITRDSTLELQSSARALESLQKMTSDLRVSVSDFRLPAGSLEKPAAADRLSKKVARSKLPIHSASEQTAVSNQLESGRAGSGPSGSARGQSASSKKDKPVTHA